MNWHLQFVARISFPKASDVINFESHADDFTSNARAYIFFSSPIPKELVSYIKNDNSVIPRIGALREVGYFTMYLSLL